MNKKSKIFKIIIAIFAILISVGIIIYLLPIFKNLTTPDGQIAFKEKIQNLGFAGLLMLFAMQIAQIFLIIIPGEPIEVLAGMCYGAFGGLIFIMVSAAIITTLIVLMVRKFGRKFVYEFCPKEKIDKIENSKMFKNPKKLELIIMILFLIPGTPKDLLVYVGALLPINPLKFIIISTLARFPSVISSTLAGDNLALGNWQVSLLIYAITFAIVGAIIFIVNKFDKSKEAEELIRNMKE